MKRTKPFIKKNISWVILALIIISSTAIRISLINKSIYMSDVTNIIHSAEQIVESPGRIIAASGRVVPGIPYGTLIPYLLSLFILLWNNNIYTMFAFAFVLWGVAAIFLYLIGKEFFNEHTGIIAALLICFGAFSLLSTTHNMNGSLSAPFVAMFAYSLFRIKFKQDTRFWVLAFVSTAFLLHTHVSVFIAPLVILVFLLFKPKINWKHFLVGFLIFILLMLPYALYIIREADLQTAREYLTRNKAADSEKGTFFKLDIISNSDITGINIFFTESLLVVLSAIILFSAMSWLVAMKKKDKSGEERLVFFQKILLLALSIIIFYSWLCIFMYQSSYGFTGIFTLACLIISVGLGEVIHYFSKKRWLWAVIIMYLILIAWAIANVLRVNQLLAGCPMGCYTYTIGLQKEIAEAIQEYQHQLSLNNETSLALGSVKAGVLQEPSQLIPLSESRVLQGYDDYLGESFEFVNYFQKKNNLVIPSDRIFMIIDATDLPYDKVKSECMKELSNHKYFIIMRNDFNPEYRFSDELEEGWNQEVFDDSSWTKEENTMTSCYIRECIDADNNVFDTDIFLRLKMTNFYGSSEKTLIVQGQSPFIIKEFFVNGIAFENEQFNNLTFREIRIGDFQKYLNPTEDNILAIHFVINKGNPPIIRLISFTKEE